MSPVVARATRTNQGWLIGQRIRPFAETRPSLVASSYNPGMLSGAPTVGYKLLVKGSSY